MRRAQGTSSNSTFNGARVVWKVLETLEARRLLSGTPVLTAIGSPTAGEGGDYVLNLSAPASANLTSWTINWGDSSAAQTVPGSTTSVIHQYHASTSPYHVSATATDGVNTYLANSTSAGANGSLASGFGTGGLLTTSNPQVANVVTTQADGKIVVAAPGSTTTTFAVYRYNADGTPDATFGTNGVVTASTSAVAFGSPKIASIAVQADKKIVVGGSVVFGSTNHLLVARFNADGSLDTSFNSTGLFVTNATSAAATGGVVHSITFDTNPGANIGKIVLGVTAGTFNGLGTIQLQGAGRLNTDGTPDASFGSAASPGFTTVDLGANTASDGTAAVFVLSGDQVLVAGNVQSRADAARFNADGSLDASYGINGIFSSASANNAFFTSAAIDSSGNLVGTTYFRNAWALTRVTPAGAADGTFGNNGALGINSLAPTANGYAAGIAIQSDGKLVVVGNGDQNTFSFITARYNVDGSLDNTFGGNGSVVTSFGGTTESAGSVNILPGGKILVGGSTVIGAASNAALVEFAVIASATPVTVQVADVPPVVSLGAVPTTVAEGTAVNVTATITDPFPTDLTNTWLVTRNGAVVASGSGTAISFIPADNGTYVLTAVSNDVGGATATASATVNVTNVAPTAVVGGDTIGVRGQARHITLGATDPSTADTAAGFTYTINWGDGSAAQVVAPGQPLNPGHVYARDGNYTVSVTAKDKDGGVSSAVTRNLAITPVALEGTTLAIGGLTQDDLLIITQYNAGGVKTLSVIDDLLLRYKFNEANFTRIDVYQVDSDGVIVSANVSDVVYLVDANGNILEVIHAAVTSPSGH